MSESKEEATTSAYLYGYPLLAFHKLARSVHEAVGSNAFRHGQVLATQATRVVVQPNPDALVSSLVFDLTATDVIFKLPPFPREYTTLASFYDQYGNNFANIGTRNLNASGEFRLQPLNKGHPRGLHTLHQDYSFYQARINSPTLLGSILIRCLLTATNTEAIRKWQNDIRIRLVSRSDTKNPLPSLEHTFSESVLTESVEKILALLAMHEKYDLLRETRHRLRLEVAGISHGIYTRMAGLDATEVKKAALQEMRAAREAATKATTNNWFIIAPECSGDFGDSYAMRALIAKVGYLMLTARNAMYAWWHNPLSGKGSDPEFYLRSNDAYIFTFAGKPPIVDDGFWSLTAYSELFLIPNNRNIYSLGDRSGLRYLDGSDIYGPHARDQDGEFQILVQPADIEPPSTWLENWLPGPAGGGKMSLHLRWYGAENSLLDSSYPYPVVSKQAVIFDKPGRL